MTLGEKIKQYREDNGLSQRDFAARVGVSEAFVYQHERECRKEATWDTLRKLTMLFDCTVEELAIECGQSHISPPKKEAKQHIQKEVGFFTNNIEYLRQRNGFSIRHIENKLSLPCNYYYHIANKTRPLSLKRARDFSEFYNIPIDTLINEQLYPKDFNPKERKKRPSTGATRRISSNEAKTIGAKTVGANIRRMREARHWSVTSLAVRTGANEAVVRRWERGTMPTDEQLEAIIEEFGCTIEDLRREITE